MTMFKDMDPFEVGASLDQKMPVMWGIFENPDDETDQSSPVGILLAEAVDGELIIRWLFVIPKYRGRCLGEALLSRCFYFAEKHKLERLSVYLDTDYARSRVCRNAGEYFRAHLFQAVTGEHMVATVEDFKKQEGDPPYSPEEEALCLYNLFGDVKPEDYNPDI